MARKLAAPKRPSRLVPPTAPSKRGPSSQATVQADPNATDTAPVKPPIDPGKPDLAVPLLKQELAISQESAIASRYELLQYNPDELFTRKGVRTLEKMATSDDTISMGLLALKMMALSSGYQLNAASEDPLDEKIADEVAANFDNFQGSLREKLFSIMGSLDLGASHHEKIWDEWQEGSDYAGHIRLVTLKSKNPQWFNPSVDDFNNITGFVMISPPAYGRKLPVRKFLIYSSQKRYENVWGTARTRALYDWWYLKGVAKAALAVLLKKYGKETPIGFVPMTMSAADKQSFLNALTNLATTAAATMPEGTRIEWAKFDATSVTSCLAVIEKADQQMTKILLGQVSSSGTSSRQAHASGGAGGTGSNSGGSSRGGAQEQTLAMYLSYITADIAENPMAELIKEIVDFNYAGVQHYPKFQFKPISEQDQVQFVQAFTAAVQAGVIVPTDEDAEHIREAVGFPTANSKTTLRPNRSKIKPTFRLLPPLPPMDPRKLPIAGYRPPTPSAPGLPANYAEEGRPALKRDLTKYEKGVDFAEAWRIVDTEGEDEIAVAAAKVLQAAVDKLKLSAKKAIGNSAAIRKLTMPYRTQLATVLAQGLKDVAKKAIKQAAREMSAKGQFQALRFAEVHNLDGMTPDDVLQLIQDRSFTMAGKISDDVLNDVKNVMYAGIKAGKSYKDIVYEMEDKLAKYVDLTQTDTDLSGHRLMNVVRTNVMSAYNDARKAVFEDPDLNGFVLAYQFSAVLDGDTTAWCADMGTGGPDGGGRIFKTTNPIWDQWSPPTWYGCRSVLVPVTKVDGWDGEESEEPTEEPPEGFN